MPSPWAAHALAAAQMSQRPFSSSWLHRRYPFRDRTTCNNNKGHESYFCNPEIASDSGRLCVMASELSIKVEVPFRLLSDINQERQCLTDEVLYFPCHRPFDSSISRQIYYSLRVVLVPTMDSDGSKKMHPCKNLLPKLSGPTQ